MTFLSLVDSSYSAISQTQNEVRHWKLTINMFTSVPMPRSRNSRLNDLADVKNKRRRMFFRPTQPSLPAPPLDFQHRLDCGLRLLGSQKNLLSNHIKLGDFGPRIRGFGRIACPGYR